MRTQSTHTPMYLYMCAFIQTDKKIDRERERERERETDRDIGADTHTGTGTDEHETPKQATPTQQSRVSKDSMHGTTVTACRFDSIANSP